MTDEQYIQFVHLRDTGNQTTEENEEQLLREKFGEPDENGVYGAEVFVEEED